mgnify:FL=1
MEIGAFEAKNTLGALLDRVQQGEEIVITRHGKRVAKLIPAEGGHDVDAALRAVERISKRAREHGEPSISVEEWKSFRDEGRP